MAILLIYLFTELVTTNKSIFYRPNLIAVKKVDFSKNLFFYENLGYSVYICINMFSYGR